MLFDELRELAKEAELTGCVVGVWLHTQDKEFQEVFGMLKNKPNLNMTKALTLVRSYYPDAPFKRTSFVAHLKGICTCPTA